MLTEIGLAEKSKFKPQLDPELKNELMTDLSPEDLGKIKKGFDLYKGIFRLIFRQSLSQGIHLHHDGRSLLKTSRCKCIRQRNLNLH
jgi:hypothetical protein